MNGDVVWARTYGEMQADAYLSFINPIEKSMVDSEFVFAGTCKTNGVNDICLVKINTFGGAGDTIWSKRYGKINGSGKSVSLSNDFGYIITGTETDSGKHYISVIKTDSAGISSCPTFPTAISTALKNCQVTQHNVAVSASFNLTDQFCDQQSSASIISLECNLNWIEDYGNKYSILFFPNPFHKTASFHVSETGFTRFN